MCYGIGATLIRRLPVSEITIVPAPSAFSLACARLGWPAEEVEYLSLCGRDPALLTAVLYPGAQLLILSADGTTPATVASSLAQQGFGSSRLIVLERLGGPHERLLESRADTWATPEVADLNLIAVHCQLAPEGLNAGGTLTTHYSRLPALPDSAYQHDGQLTKREVRAVTLSALAPLPGHLLWDIGAGCGSIGIEWMRSHPRCRAIAVEQHPTRLQYLANNALALGTPQLKIVAGQAPDVLRSLPQPAAIFIGGGMTQPRLLETCWEALPVGGRLVANAVTVEGEHQLFQWQQQRGGELTRLAIQRAEPIGHFLGWKALAPVTQWVVVKSSLE
jgi:precorrin-6Y C5,15-methyltransferase (decarboxylating)